MSRKVIGLITAFPESISVQRIFSGIFSQCQKYGYDVAVFSSLELTCNAQKNLMEGELYIYHLINYDRLDAVIVDTASLRNGGVTKVADKILEDLRTKCKKPVISLGETLGDYPCFCVSDRALFREISQHIFDIHQCKNVYFLTGSENNPVSEDRLNGYLDYLSEKGLPADEKKIFYGDFWYSGGKALAERIVSGELEKPDGIICASDHMAIGLVNHLVENGFKVPKDIVVTGFDATEEAAINSIAISTFTPDSEKTMVEAVNEIRRQIDPDKELFPYVPTSKDHFRVGGSCGCPYEHEYIAKMFKNSLYYTHHDYSKEVESFDIGTLIESNMLEYLCDTSSLNDYLVEIIKLIYLIRPYSEFFLCMDQNWLNADLCCATGYPKQMDAIIYMNREKNTAYYPNHVFDTKLMLPELGNEEREPSVFYFMPVHFLEKTMGYAVLIRPISTPHYVNCVVRKWLKNINCSLEIFRTRNRLHSLSTKDGMTGVYNRRGMELMLDEMMAKANPKDSMLALVIDMDNLKQLNDTYGHLDGDFGIKAICNAVGCITKEKELCVRAGGDEFYVIGIGEYTLQEAAKRIASFEKALEEINQKSGKPYQLSASIGSACIPLSSGMNTMGIIKIADAKMYENKVQKKIKTFTP